MEVKCAYCGSIVKTKYGTCTHCGAPLEIENNIKKEKAEEINIEKESEVDYIVTKNNYEYSSDFDINFFIKIFVMSIVLLIFIGIGVGLFFDMHKRYKETTEFFSQESIRDISEYDYLVFNDNIIEFA